MLSRGRVSCCLEQFDNGEVVAHVGWRTDAAGLALGLLPELPAGQLMRLSFYQLDPAAAGTYDLELRDDLDCDQLDGLGTGLSVNAQSTVAVLLRVNSVRSRTLYLVGLHHLYVDAGAQETHGAVDLYFRVQLD